MKRFACSLVLVLTACGVKGPPTGKSNVSGTTPSIMSAGANSFTGADANNPPQMVKGWTIYLFSNGPGANCNSADTKVVASIGIFTNQMADSTHKTAQLAEGEYTIVTQSPPPVNGTGGAATMGANGLDNIGGLVTITDFYAEKDGTVDHISGTVAASGTSSTGDTVQLMGDFTAPNCD
jgi:hypothetical protein